MNHSGGTPPDAAIYRLWANDGNSVRVTKSSGGSTTVYIFSGGKVVAEYLNGSLSAEYIYLGGKLLATHSGTTLTYHHWDLLSVRVNTDGTTGAVVGEQGHYPYGEAWYTSGTTTKYLFTTYERDSDSGNDYAISRSYVNRLARFSAPDPIRGPLTNPQRLNRYSYVKNDPTNLVDPTGMDVGDQCDRCHQMCEGQYSLCQAACMVGSCGLFGNRFFCRPCLAVCSIGRSLCHARCTAVDCLVDIFGGGGRGLGFGDLRNGLNLFDDLDLHDFMILTGPY